MKMLRSLVISFVATQTALYVIKKGIDFMTDITTRQPVPVTGKAADASKMRESANKNGTKEKVNRGYDEDEPTDPGAKLNKKPEKVPRKKRTSVKGKHGSGTNQGPAQELPDLVKQKKPGKKKPPKAT